MVPRKKFRRSEFVRKVTTFVWFSQALVPFPCPHQTVDLKHLVRRGTEFEQGLVLFVLPGVIQHMKNKY